MITIDDITIMRDELLTLYTPHERETMSKEAKKLSDQTIEEGFWNDSSRAQSISKKLSLIQSEIDDIDFVDKGLSDIAELIDFADLSLSKEIELEFHKVQTVFSKLRIAKLFDGPYDNEGAIISIHAGTGGIDAQDFAEMLMRMYIKYIESKDWKMTVIDLDTAIEAGIKGVYIEIDGPRAYGHLRVEHGVHRLVRLSPFNSKNSRETSFALVEVLPLLDNNDDFLVDESEVRVDVFRASGHGGQGVNTTDSAVRLTHLPTGTTVTCQNERSQLQNKQTAYKILASRLRKIDEQKKEDEMLREKGEFKQGTWGNQIRSYVMQPYTMVKDHRTGYETADVQKVFAGDIEEFVIAMLQKKEHNK